MNRIGIIIPNLIKLGGLVVGLIAPHGAFSAHPEALVLAVSGFMMAGAQLSEHAIFGIVDRFLGRQSDPTTISREEEEEVKK